MSTPDPLDPSASSTDPAPASSPDNRRQELVAGLKQGVVIAAAVMAVALPAFHFYFRDAGRSTAQPAVSAVEVAPGHTPRFAQMGNEPSSPDALYIANWVADSGDNQNLSFVIIDKKNTRVYVFDPSAKLLGATPVLLGAMPGDDSVAGIGKKKISDVLPQERTTPAGRFMGEPGRNLSGENVVWVDYDAAVSMHRVRIVDPKERRLERLASATTDDNRISFGCVNVPVAFFEKTLAPVFNKSYGVIYVLPEERQLHEIFKAAYDPAEKAASAKAMRSGNSLRLAVNAQ